MDEIGDIHVGMWIWCVLFLQIFHCLQRWLFGQMIPRTQVCS